MQHNLGINTKITYDVNHAKECYKKAIRTVQGVMWQDLFEAGVPGCGDVQDVGHVKGQVPGHWW
jgi:hypothetical protein